MGYPYSTSPSLPDKGLVGKFKNIEQNQVIHKIYKVTETSILKSKAGPICEPITVECSKKVLKWLRGQGIEARFVAEFPDRVVVRIGDGKLPEWFLKSFSEIEAKSIRDVLGFDEGDLLYYFGDASQSMSPYDVLRRKPYKCPALRRLSIKVFYERPEYWETLESLLNRHVDRALLEFVELDPKSLKDIWDLDVGGVKLALLDGKTLESKLREIAEIKSRSYNGLSTLQLVNGDKLLGGSR